MQLSSIKDAESLLDIMGKKYVKRIHPNRPYWLIKAPRWGLHRDFEKKRQAFLHHFLKAYSNLVLYEDYYDINENGLKGNWINLEGDKSTWVVPSDVDPEELYKFFHAGEWHIYTSTSAPIHYDLANYRLGESRSYDVSEVIRLFLEQDYSLLLYAFADNDPWFFGIKPEYFQSGKVT